MTDLSPAAQAVLNAYRDLSWTPDEKDNGRYYKFSHKAGMAAALRAAADQIQMKEPFGDTDADAGVFAAHQAIHAGLLAIAAELDGTNHTGESD